MINRSELDEKWQKIFYGQVPLKLLRDPTIISQAKALYALIHTYCQNKDLFSKPRTMISEITLARASGVTTTTIRSWLDILKKHSWISVKRKGYGRPNEYTLLSKRDSEAPSLRQKYRKLTQHRRSEDDESGNS